MSNLNLCVTLGRLASVGRGGGRLWRVNGVLGAGALAIAAVSPAAHAQCPASFAAAVNFAAGSSPFYVAIGDYNGDGRADLAVANLFGNNVSVLLGNGNGTFAAAVNFGAGANPTSVAVGDFNADGRADLAVANSSGTTVSVLLGNGNGTFAAAVNFGAGSGPISVAVGDFNGDGRADLAAANQSSANVSVLLGNGLGSFAAAVNFGVGVTPRSVAVGDFNADGRADLAVANRSSGNVSVLLGNGNGTFAAAVNFGVGAGPISVAVGDFNGDGSADLVTANNSGGTASVLLGNGNGTFAAAVNFGVGSGLTSVAVGDFNGDGRADLTVSNSNDDNVSVLLGNGNGTFATAVNFGVGAGPNSVAVGDFNAEGRADLAVASSANGGNVSVLRNTTAGNPLPVFTLQPVGQVVQAGANVSFTAAANFVQGPAPYRWRRNGVPLANGGNISGATTATLTINPVSTTDEAVYDVQAISDTCAGVQSAATSTAVVLGVGSGIFNDSCSSPRPVFNDQPMTFSTVGATTDGPTEANLGFCCGDLQVNQDLWFLYTATSTGVTRVSLCGSNFDSKVAIYQSTTCPSGSNTAIAGNDDSCGTQSLADFACVDGVQYLIRVGGYLTSVGTVQMSVTTLSSCQIDFNGDGFVDFFDYDDFVAEFEAGC